METVALWLLRLVDAGPEFYFLMAAFIGYVYKMKGRDAQHDKEISDIGDRLTAQVATEKEENHKLWVECRQLAGNLNNEIKAVSQLHHKDRNKSDTSHRESLKLEVARIENRIEGLTGIIHRLDALNYGQSKVIEATTGVKLINGSANGAGDYTLNREINT